MALLELWTASHFICVQIFQMDSPPILFTSKYCRNNFRGWSEQFQMTTRAWKSWVELFMRMGYLTQELLCKYFQKNIFYIRSSISPWREPQRRLLFRILLLYRVPLFTMQNFVFRWAPVLPFWEIFLRSWQILFST